MPSLNEILADKAPLLLLDAAGPTVHAGWLGAGPPRWAAFTAEAGTGLFSALEGLGIKVAEARAFAFCEGPGSILGIRTTAMALRAWCAIAPRPVYAYQSLDLLCRGLARPGLTVIADARRGLWHRQRPGEALDRVPADALTPPLATPEPFRAWEPLPPGTERVPYRPDLLFGDPAVASAPVLRETADPDAFLHSEPSYAAWVPQIHRNP
jgi:tRNA threonylcarbamoyladenosine biosynthesis protein TsaB